MRRFLKTILGIVIIAGALLLNNALKPGVLSKEADIALTDAEKDFYALSKPAVMPIKTAEQSGGYLPPTMNIWPSLTRLIQENTQHTEDLRLISDTIYRHPYMPTPDISTKMQRALHDNADILAAYRAIFSGGTLRTDPAQSIDFQPLHPIGQLAWIDALLKADAGKDHEAVARWLEHAAFLRKGNNTATLLPHERVFFHTLYGQSRRVLDILMRQTPQAVLARRAEIETVLNPMPVTDADYKTAARFYAEHMIEVLVYTTEGIKIRRAEEIKKNILRHKIYLIAQETLAIIQDDRKTDKRSALWALSKKYNDIVRNMLRDENGDLYFAEDDAHPVHSSMGYLLGARLPEQLAGYVTTTERDFFTNLPFIQLDALARGYFPHHMEAYLADPAASPAGGVTTKDFIWTDSIPDGPYKGKPGICWAADTGFCYSYPE